jgi:hypothetical protein
MCVFAPPAVFDWKPRLIPIALLVGDASDAARRPRAGWALALFLLGGVSTRIAAIAPIQLSVWAMFGLLVFLAREPRRAEVARP